MATEVWSQLLNEHQTNSDNHLPHSLFYENSLGNYTPRGIVADYDSFTVNKFQKSSVGDNFENSQMVY